MDYILDEKKKGYIDVKISSDGMYGLDVLLEDSYSFYAAYYEKEQFRKDYDDDCLVWGTESVDVDSVGEDLLEIVPSYGTGTKTEEEIDRQKKHTIIVPRKALMEFIKLYRCADREEEEWTTRRVEFDGKEFRLWVDGEEYKMDQAKAEWLEIYHKYGR